MLGPREQLQAVLERVQDLGLVQLVEPAESESLSLLGLTPEQQRHVRGVRKVVKDVDAALELLGETPRPRRAAQELDLRRAALIAGRCRRELEALAEQHQQLEEVRSGPRRHSSLLPDPERGR
jgi:hypothetical protein